MSRISDAEWTLVIFAAAFIDVVQFILDVFLLGIVANRFIDGFVGILLPIYMKWRGVKMDNKKVGAIVVSFLLEFLGIGLDSLPFWTADVLLLRYWDKKDKNNTIIEA